MKVIICGPEPSLQGGVTIWMKMVLEYFANNPHPDIQVSHLSIKRSVSLTHMLPLYKKMFYAIKDYACGYWVLKKKLKREKYDVVHIVSSAGLGILRDWLFVKLAKKYHSAAVVHYHCGTIPQHLQTSGWLQFLLIRVLRMSDKIAVLDTNTLKSIHEAGFENAVKIGNPYNPMIAQVVASTGERESKVLLFVGHIVPAKGIRELLQAVHDIPNIKLKCFGPEDPRFQRELTNYISINSMSDRVTFHGIRPSVDIYTEMCKAALFVLPTYTEGFPFVVVEAMACGCPIVSTPVGAIEEMLCYEEKVQGVLIQPRNVDQLKNAIMYCLDHLDECSKRAMLAQQKAKGEYSLEAVMSQLSTIWCNIIKDESSK